MLRTVALALLVLNITACGSEVPAVFRLPTGRSHAAFGGWS